MATPFPVYPGGSTGAGLLLLRLATVVALLTHGLFPALAAQWQWFAAGLCVSLALGVWTRRGACLGALGAALFGLAVHDPQSLTLSACQVVLMLTGPGAFALDARAWGRLHVRLR
jgi:uncharacterized membrane protein YphA (DoxX/SURF4 family)